MKHQQFRVTNGNRNARLTALLLLLALVCAALPGARAQQQSTGRPRRVDSTTKQGTTSTTTPQQTRTTATPQQTPTPRPAPAQTPNPTGTPAPKLQSSPTTTTVDPNASQAQNEAGQEVDDDETIRIEANEIKLNVRVVDRNNRPVEDVRKEDFRVFENGQPQAIQFFTRQEVPITYGIVVDNSGSLRHQINQVIDASKVIINSNKPGDEAFVVRFISSDKIELKQDFTANKEALNDALEDMYVEGGQTAVIDAVYVSAEHAAEHKTGSDLDDRRRRAVILVTDGEDRNSTYKQEQLFELLREQDVQIFVVGFVNELDKEGGFISKSKREKAMDLLNRLAKETGGRAFYPTSLSELPSIAEQITKDMRTQYVISYTPATKARPGEFRAVRVAVADAPGREKRIAITRSGYTAPREDGTPATPANGPAPSVRRP